MSKVFFIILLPFFLVSCDEAKKIRKNIERRINKLEVKLGLKKPKKRSVKKSKKKQTNSSIYTVREVSGDISFWAPLGTEWQTLEVGDDIKVGSLLQIAAGSKLRIKFPPQKSSSFEGDSIYLNVNVPMSFRLDDNIVRRIKDEKRFFNEVPKQNKKAEKEFRSTFQWAWDRITAFVEFNEENQESIADLFKELKDPTEIGIKSKKITLYDPLNGAGIFTDSFPTEIEVYWEKIKGKRLDYHIHLWHEEEPKSEAYAVTKNNQFTLRIDEPGSYFVQVSADTDRYLSSAHIFHVSNPNARLSEDEKYQVENQIVLKYPIDDSLAFLPKRGKQKFSWTISEKNSLESLELYFEEINPEKKKLNLFTKKIPLKIDENYIDVRLPRFKFKWWIEGKALSEDKKGKEKQLDIKSNVHRVTLHRIIYSVDKIMKLVESKKYRSIYVNEKSFL